MLKHAGTEGSDKISLPPEINLEKLFARESFAQSPPEMSEEGKDFLNSGRMIHSSSLETNELNFGYQT